MKSNKVFVFLCMLSLALVSLNSQQIYTVCNQNCDFQTDWISPELIIPDIPSQYFLCGYAFRTMKWEKSLYNCNCQQTPNRGTQCEYCNNTFYTMTNGFKATFCHYSDWNKQIQKIFQTGNTQVGQWRQTKCPKGTFAHKIAARLSTQQQDVYVGLNGLQIRCESIYLNQSSTIQDNSPTFMSGQSQNKPGNFISALKLIYIPNSQLTGIVIFFESIPIITMIEIIYSLPQKLNMISKIIESYQFLNTGNTNIQKSTLFTKSYSIQNSWTNELPNLNSYMTSPALTIQLPKTNDENSIQAISKSQPMIFAKGIQTTYMFSQQKAAIVRPCQSLKINSLIKEQRVRLTYSVTITLSNRNNGQFVSKLSTNGIFQGYLTSGPFTSSVQTKIDNCTIFTSTLTIEQILNSNWGWWNNWGFIDYVNFRKGGTIVRPKQISAYEWKFDGDFLVFYFGGKQHVRFTQAFRDFNGKWRLQGFFPNNMGAEDFIIQF